jgi:AcrR family transcriptional regulator
VVTSLARGPRPRVAPTRRTTNGQARGDETRQRILDETVRCVREEGFAAASANHIAERAGVTWGVIQYHFGDRDGLLMAVIEAGYDLLRGNIKCVTIPSAGTPGQRVSALVDAASDAFADPRSLAAFEILIGTRANRNPAVNARLAELGQELAQLGQEVSGDAGAPTSDIGGLLWTGLRGLALTEMVVDAPVDSTADRAALVDALTAYLERSQRG